MEKKTNELLLMESILLYTEADGSLTAQSFNNPLLGGTKLLHGMDRAHLCPPPPALLGAIDAADARECVANRTDQYDGERCFTRGVMVERSA